jgi:hypothetical protein
LSPDSSPELSPGSSSSEPEEVDSGDYSDSEGSEFEHDNQSDSNNSRAKHTECDDADTRNAIKAAAKKWTEADSAELNELKRALRGEGFDFTNPIKVSNEHSYYKFFEDLKGLSSVEAISLFVRLTAHTPKQEGVARHLHRYRQTIIVQPMSCLAH